MEKKAATSSVNFDVSSSIPNFKDLDYGEEEEEGLERSAKKKPKMPNVKGPLDLLFTSSAEEVVKKRKETMIKQTTINEACKKELRTKEHIEKGYMILNSYIYVRPGLVNMLREFIGRKDLVRAVVTRFAIAFLTLESIHKQKANLRKMFTSDKWTNSKWAKEALGKRVCDIVLMATFWTNIVYILKIFGPLVQVLRLVNGERKPSMEYIYEAMDRAKVAIAKSFNEKEESYKKVFEIIDKRWECQLHQSLHACVNYLNHELFYANPNISSDQEVMRGLLDDIERLVPRLKEQDLISNQLSTYANSTGIFGKPMAIRHMSIKSPSKFL
ncbi:hypothetical protein Cni_G09990 [Canna indica]|uniref:Uncharacterized protein n=1 Tax=Canna indica TaxID=4628 RepID=A0AAQ3Q866_9LILI|nr:hypothetical protein Cni_G09990 [Canna indica]